MEIYTHKIRNIFNKIVNLAKFFLIPTCTTVLYKLGLFDGEILLQLVQTACTSCNLCRLFVQVATCVKSQLMHNIYINICPL